MRRPGSNECLQDKPRNRHFAEWRFFFADYDKLNLVLRNPEDPETLKSARKAV